jgi:small nuclear ribonucleoprotein (snRNP)-like protein
MTNTINLAAFKDTNVIVKLRNTGRAISGFLKETDGKYTIKLGVLHIDIDEKDVARVSAL